MRLGIKAQFVMKVSLIYIIFTVCFMIGIYVNSSRFYYMPPCKAYKLLTGHLSTNQPELKVEVRNDIAIVVQIYQTINLTKMNNPDHIINDRSALKKNILMSRSRLCDSTFIQISSF